MSKKVQTAVRLERPLIEALKKQAKADHRSLNNYIEHLLYRAVGNIPNADTRAAMKEAQGTINLEKMEDVDDFFEAL